MPPASTGKPKFTPEERAAMRERLREEKAERTREAGEADVQAKIAEMPPADRELAERFHAIVAATAPELVPRTWYGMPAYAREDKIVCYFRNASKFKTRYAIIGFSDKANLDDGPMWPTEFALTKLTRASEAEIKQLIRRAVS